MRNVHFSATDWATGAARQEQVTSLASCSERVVCRNVPGNEIVHARTRSSAVDELSPMSVTTSQMA